MDKCKPIMKTAAAILSLREGKSTVLAPFRERGRCRPVRTSGLTLFVWEMPNWVPSHDTTWRSIDCHRNRPLWIRLTFERNIGRPLYIHPFWGKEKELSEPSSAEYAGRGCSRTWMHLYCNHKGKNVCNCWWSILWKYLPRHDLLGCGPG